MQRVAAGAVLAALGALACAAPPASPWRASWQDRGAVRTIDCGDGTLWTLDAGEGDAVILLHGLGGSAYDWREVVASLAERGFRAVVPDLLGCGASEIRTNEDYCPVAQAQRVVALARALGIERAFVAGNSYGGAVAAAMAFEEPEFVRALVLISPAIVEQTPPLYIGVARVPVVGEIAYGVAPTRTVVRRVLARAWGPEGEPPEEVVEEYVREQRRPGRTHANLHLARDFDDRHARGVLHRLGEIRCPVLVLWGTDDAVTPVENAAEVARRIPHAWIERIEGTGHVPHMTRPVLIVARLADWLRHNR